MAAHIHLIASSSSTSSSPLSRRFRSKPSLFSSSSPSNRFTNLFFKPFSLRPTSQLSLSFQDPLIHGIASNSYTLELPSSNRNRKSKPEAVPYVWINPNNPRSSQLRQKSYDATYRALVSVAETLNSCNPSLEDISRVLDSLGHELTEQDAVTVLNNMKNPATALFALEYFLNQLKASRQVVLYNVTLKVLRKCRDFGNAEKLFDEMLQRGVQPDNVTFSTLITCARFCSLFQKAMELYDKMPEYGCQPDSFTCSTMIDVYGRAGDSYKALSLYERARTEKWRLDVVTFCTLIRVYAKAGNFDGCLNAYEEMKALGSKPSAELYNVVLDCMGKARKPWQAKNIYKDMIGNGVKPTWWTYSALLRGFCKARYGADAIKIYKEMKEKGFKFNVVMYNALFAMCADIGYSDEAALIFEDMKSLSSCKPDSWTYSSMVTVYSCNGQVDEAELLLNEMLQAGLQPNIFILTSLVQCYGKANRTDDVVRTFNQSVELGINSDDRFCGSLLNVMTQTPVQELGKLIDCIERANEQLGFVLRLLAEGNSENTVFSVAALQLFGSISPDVKKAYCNCLIDLCINLNLLEKACELLDMGLKLGIYYNMQSRTPAQWVLHLKTLSHGAALTALHIWMNDLTRALEYGEELSDVLVINTGHGKHKYSEKGLSGVIISHLKKLNSPFRESAEEVGCLLTTRCAALAWLESRKEVVISS